MTKKPISIDSFEIKLSKKYKDENARISKLFHDEWKNLGDYSAPKPVTYKFGEFEYNANGYYKGTLLNSKFNNFPLGSEPETQTTFELPLTPKQALGYSTSFIFDTYTQILMIERIQNGVTSERFNDYFIRCQKMTDKFRFSNVFDPKILLNYKAVVKVRSFKIQIAKVTNGAIFHSKDKSVSQIVDASEDTNADEIIITLKSKGKSNHLSLPKIKSLVDKLRDFNSDNRKEVQKLEIIGYDEDDKPLKPFDLVSEIMHRKIEVEPSRHNNAAAVKVRLYELEQIFLSERKDLIAAYDKRLKDE